MFEKLHPFFKNIVNFSLKFYSLVNNKLWYKKLDYFQMGLNKILKLK